MKAKQSILVGELLGFHFVTFDLEQILLIAIHFVTKPTILLFKYLIYSNFLSHL